MSDSEFKISKTSLSYTNPFSHNKVPPSNTVFLVDSGTTNHFVTTQAAQTLGIGTAPHAPLTVSLPDGTSLESKSTTTLNLPGVPVSCAQAHVIDALQEPSLLAIAPFCDSGMLVTFSRLNVQVTNPLGEIILHGDRNFETKLWEFTSPDVISRTSSSDSHCTASIHRIFHCPKQDSQLVKFFHAALCFPSESTLIRAIDQGLVKLPGLTSALVRRFPTHSWATAKGHLDRTRQGILPTSSLEVFDSSNSDSNVSVSDFDSTVLDSTADEAAPGSHEAHIAVISIPTSDILYSDPTGHLLTKSARGHDYIMVIFSVASNYILPIPMKGRTAEEHMRAFSVAHSFFRSHGFTANLHVMDNECAEDTKLFLQNYNIQTQQVPPGNHRANKSERAIRTFKNHFIAAVNGLPASFPKGQWDRLLPQIELTLNLLRPCHSRPGISAWEAVNGAYDYHRHPIAPLGTPVLIFEAPAQRGSYAAHGVPGFYLGPSFSHYRCFVCWASHSQSTRVTDTVSWHPLEDPFPESQPDQLLGRARALLASPASSILPRVADIALRHLDAALEAIAGAPHFSIPRDLEGPHTPPGFLPFKSADPFVGRVPVASTPTIAPDLSTFVRETPVIPRVAVPPRVYNTPTLEQYGTDPRVDIPPIPDDASAEQYGAIPRVGGGPAADTEIPSTTDILTTPVEDGEPNSATSGPARVRKPTTWTSMSARAPTPMFSISKISLSPLARLLRGPEGPRWNMANEAEFIRHLEEFKSMKFVKADTVPHGTKFSLWHPSPSIKTDADGDEKYRVRGCMNPNPTGRSYEDVAALTAALLNVKIILNVNVSEDRIWSTADIKDFYLHSGLIFPEYMRIPLRMIPDSIKQKYQLDLLYPAPAEHAIVLVTGAIFGHPQSGKIAQDELLPHLFAAGYAPIKDMPMCFSDADGSTRFCLVVDDFGISSKTQEGTDRLLATLRQFYPITHDPRGRKFLGMKIHHDRVLRKLTISMPGYIQQALDRFNLKAPNKPVLTPLPYNVPNYGQKVQQPVEDDSPPASEADKKLVQQVIGVLNYYARAIDYSMLVAVNKIASQQAAPTTQTMVLLRHLLDYAASFPDACITYYPSKMQLIQHSDAAFLTETKARSRSAGFCYLSLGGIDDFVNGGLDAHSSIMPNVVPSVVEAEYGSIFRNAQDATPIRNALIALGYPQPPTIIVTDNSVACGIANKTLKSKRSKSMDNKFNWIQDQIRLGNFQVIWRPGAQNLADFVSKSHPPTWHQFMRNLLLSGNPPFILRDMRPLN